MLGLLWHFPHKAPPLGPVSSLSARELSRPTNPTQQVGIQALPLSSCVTLGKPHTHLATIALPPWRSRVRLRNADLSTEGLQGPSAGGDVPSGCKALRALAQQEENAALEPDRLQSGPSFARDLLGSLKQVTSL